MIKCPEKSCQFYFHLEMWVSFQLNKNHLSTSTWKKNKRNLVKNRKKAHEKVRSLPTSERNDWMFRKKSPSTICYVIGYLLRKTLSVLPPMKLDPFFSPMFADGAKIIRKRITTNKNNKTHPNWKITLQGQANNYKFNLFIKLITVISLVIIKLS